MSSSKRPGKKPSGTPGRGSAGRSKATGSPGRPSLAPWRAGTGPPASARLTIKPPPPGAHRSTIELPPRPRPGGSRRLSEVVLEEDEQLTESFEALFNGMTVVVTAVLERTCVYLAENGDRRLASKNDFWVEADKLPIRRRGIGGIG